MVGKILLLTLAVAALFAVILLNERSCRAIRGLLPLRCAYLIP